MFSVFDFAFKFCFLHDLFVYLVQLFYPFMMEYAIISSDIFISMEMWDYGFT